MVMSDKECAKLFDTVIETNKSLEGVKSDTHWLKHNAEIQVTWCKRNEDRINELEKWGSRSKGYFKILGSSLAVIATGIVALFLFFYQLFGRS